MAAQPAPHDAKPRSATKLVRELRERNAPSRERVLRSIQRLREIADAKRRRRQRSQRSGAI
jgi:hypothetical protein